MSWRRIIPDTLDRYVDALCDPARRHRAVLAFIIAYIAVWTLYAVIAKSTQDMNVDMAEMVIWSRVPGFGYPRHPPFLAWVVGAWFAVFPVADWAYYLLAVTVVASGLYLAFVLAGEWLDGAKRALVPFFLALIPFYNFHGLKFDQNSALIPLWALGIWAFVRSLESRRGGWAALAGLAVGAAVLTKYWSVFLVAGLGIAALLDERRALYFKSRAPWISIAAGALLIGPHVWWLFANDFPPFIHAGDRQTESPRQFLEAVFIEYLGGTFAYAIVALGLLIALTRPSFTEFREVIPPPRGMRWLAWNIFWFPILLPIAGAALAKINLLSLWSAPAYSLMPVVATSSPNATITKRTLSWFVAVVSVVALAALAASPIVALTRLRSGVENYSPFARLLAAEAEKEWRQTTNRPLGILAGPFVSVHSTAFYLPGKPLTLALYGPFRFSAFMDFSRYISPWINDARIAREGVAITCPAGEPKCIEQMERLIREGPPGRKREVELTPRWLGMSGPSERFIIATIPPR